MPSRKYGDGCRSKHYLSCDVNGDKNQEGDKAGNAQCCESKAITNIANGLWGWVDMDDSKSSRKAPGASRQERREKIHQGHGGIETVSSSELEEQKLCAARSAKFP